MPKDLRMLIVDDHEVDRAGMRLILEEVSGWRSVAKFDSLAGRNRIDPSEALLLSPRFE